MTKQEVRVGMRVYANRTIDNRIHIHEIGTVCDTSQHSWDDVSQEIVCVRWDEHEDTRHTCDGTCDEGHGWAVHVSEIDLVDEELCGIEVGDRVEFLIDAPDGDAAAGERGTVLYARYYEDRQFMRYKLRMDAYDDHRGSAGFLCNDGYGVSFRQYKNRDRILQKINENDTPIDAFSEEEILLYLGVVCRR